MSTVMRSAVATTPIDTGVLIERLLTLRTEIDAILEHLARQIATGREEAPTLAEPMQIAAEPAVTEMPEAETEATVAAEPISAGQPTPAYAIEIEPELAADVPAMCAAEAELAPTASIDADMAATEPVDVVSATDAGSPHQSLLADDAIEPVAASEAASAPEALVQEPSEVEPQAEPAMMAPTNEAPAETVVISLDAHRPAPKTTLQAARPVAKRPYRVKIAACILIGLAVAGLAFADLAALGSAPSGASFAPSTTPFTSGWTLQRLWQGLQRSDAPDAPDAAIDAQASLPLIEGFPVSVDRYRAAWPSGS